MSEKQTVELRLDGAPVTFWLEHLHGLLYKIPEWIKEEILENLKTECPSDSSLCRVALKNISASEYFATCYPSDKFMIFVCGVARRAEEIEKKHAERPPASE